MDAALKPHVARVEPEHTYILLMELSRRNNHEVDPRSKVSAAARSNLPTGDRAPLYNGAAGSHTKVQDVTERNPFSRLFKTYN